MGNSLLAGQDIALQYQPRYFDSDLHCSLHKGWPAICACTAHDRQGRAVGKKSEEDLPVVHTMSNLLDKPIRLCSGP
jgi:hypothetical protein